MSDNLPDQPPEPAAARQRLQIPRRGDFRLLRRVLLYHFVLAIVVISATLVFPDFIETLPVGGVLELAEGGELSVEEVGNAEIPPEDFIIVETFIQATSKLDSLGYARQLIMVLAFTGSAASTIRWTRPL